MRIAPLLVLLALVGCKSELRKEHDALATALVQPVARMCLILPSNKEGGGCHGDCVVRADAVLARAANRAGEHLAALAPQADAATEVLVARVRTAALALTREYGPACKEKVDYDAPPTEGVKACGHMWSSRQALYAEMSTALDALAAGAKTQSGADLPSLPASCPDLAKVQLR